MVCPNCKAQIPDDAQVCPNCGADTNTQAQLSNNPPQQDKNATGKSNKSSKIKYIIIAAILVVAAIIGIIVVSTNNNKQNSEVFSTEESNEGIADETEIDYHKLGESVETDIVRLTLNNAQFAVEISSSSSSTNYPSFANHYNARYFTAKNYDPRTTNYYVAEKGNVYIPISLTIESIDSRTTVDLGGFANEYMKVKYNGIEKEVEFNQGAKSDDNFLWVISASINQLVSRGETKYYHGYIEFPAEVTNLDDTFEISFNLPDSEGNKTLFTYKVEAADRNKIKLEQLAANAEAIGLGSADGGFLVSNADKFRTVDEQDKDDFDDYYENNPSKTVTEKDILNGKKFYAVYNIDGQNKATILTFCEDGTIKSEDGLANSKWAASNDTVTLTLNGTEYVCDMKYIYDIFNKGCELEFGEIVDFNTYVLSTEEKPLLILNEYIEE